MIELVEPPYKCYKYLYEYTYKLIDFLNKKKIKFRLKRILLDFLFELRYYCNTKSIINYSINFININENINCLLYECSKYKFPNRIRKIIRHLEQYHRHHQKK